MFKRTVGDLARRPVTVTMDVTAAAAAATMAARKVNILAVLAGRRVVGFVTERDLCLHLDVDLEPATPVSEYLTRSVGSVTRATLVDEVVKLMLEQRARHLLVLDGPSGNLLGLVTDRELVDALAVDFMVENVLCRELLRDDTVVTEPVAPVRQALGLIRDRNVSCVLVVKDGKPAGIFTERDAIARILGHPERLAEPIASHMSAPVVCVPTEAMVYKVILFMRQRGVRRVAVIGENGDLAGILTQRHILAYARRLG